MSITTPRLSVALAFVNLGLIGFAVYLLGFLWLLYE
jgi:preprotein translocase subunit Sss1